MAAARGRTLIAGLPLPSDEPKDLWFQLWQASGTPVFMPANIKHQVLRALDGDGAGLADQILTAVGDMSAEQRGAAAAVIGRHLAGYADHEGAWLGERWLRDAETNAWQLVHAERNRPTCESRSAFRDGLVGIRRFGDDGVVRGHSTSSQSPYISALCILMR
ncbi:hypothetical protein [Streptomyces sp. NPDC002889]|uniref:hypothetical protein n=1 Tax=Streptomyces sp. NPDC002889 TaxID=3364669 RepID=UPI0036B5A218